jgi:serine/threonine protein kinase
VSLASGTRLGHYEIIAAIGVGGMGEVYRARDARLNRDVAIKVLRDASSLDPNRLARFEREAQLLAALNHPHIATLHGLESSGAMEYLVMELVPGPTLADRIRAGPLDVADALPLFEQISAALEAAHDKGIVHRDLKPANIKVTPEGQVKVLDFGLATSLVADEGSRDLSESPTIAGAISTTGRSRGLRRT